MKIWATMTSIVLLSGMLGFGFSPDAFAGHVDGKGKALGCEKGMAKNNPHCVEEPPDPLTNCDVDMNGEITAAEVFATNPPITEFDALVAVAGADLNSNGVIDTQAEVDVLNLNALINCV